MGAALYAEAAPPAALAGHVCCVWVNRGGDGGSLQRVLPDGCADIVWNDGRLVVAGPATGAVLVPIPARRAATGVRFGPGAVGAALGLPARELRDRTLGLEELWGAEGRRLEEVLAERPSRDALVLLTAAVAARLRAAPPPDATVAAVARLLDRGATVAGAARAAGLGDRQLRRRFHEAVGYGPKTLQRVLRLRRFLDVAEAAPGDGLARAAAESGYADQPHLTRECADLAGLPPAALLASRARSSIAVP